MDNLELNNVFGKPYVFKNKLKLYPIKLIKTPDFYDVVRCLLINKNREQNVEVIKMSYLKFLFELGKQDHNVFRMLDKLLRMVLHKEVGFKVDEKGKILLFADDVVITEKDFDEIKNIILKQNCIKLDEEILDPELEKKIQEAKEFMNRRNGKMAELEQKIIAYHCETGRPYEEIANYTIYQFNKGIERLNWIKEADAINTAKYSGFVDFGNANTPSWLSHIEDKDPNEDVLMEKESFDKMATDMGLAYK